MRKEDRFGRDPFTGQFSTPPEVPFNEHGSEHLPGTSDNPKSRAKEFRQMDEMPGKGLDLEETIRAEAEDGDNYDVEEPHLGSGEELSIEEYRALEGYRNEEPTINYSGDGQRENLELRDLSAKAKFSDTSKRKGSPRNIGRKPKTKHEKGGASIKGEVIKGLDRDASLNIDDIEDAA